MKSLTNTEIEAVAGGGVFHDIGYAIGYAAGYVTHEVINALQTPAGSAAYNEVHASGAVD